MVQLLHRASAASYNETPIVMSVGYTHVKLGE